MSKSFELGAALAAAIVVFCSYGNGALAQEAAPDATVAPPGVMASFITAGQPDPKGKVPALNAVTGSGVHTLSISQPLVILQHGLVYTYLLASENNTFTGTCVDSYSLVRGTTVLAHATIKSYACKANTYWDWAINGTAIPNKPGIARLIGTVTYGGKTATTTTVVLIK